MSKAFGVAAVLMGLPAAVNAAPLPNSQKDATVIFRDRPSGACTASCPCGPFPVSAPIFITSASSRNAAFDSGVANQTVHSVGTRLWGQAGAWDYNTEGVFQFGSFGARDIRAWTIASNTGYTIGSLWGQPRLGLQADAASGGGPGGALKDFYPLFPKYAYFTEAQINAPINMVDVFPSVTIQPRRDFAVTAGVDFLWL